MAACRSRARRRSLFARSAWNPDVISSRSRASSLKTTFIRSSRRSLGAPAMQSSWSSATSETANAYHRKVRNAASDEVVFPGSIYDPDVTAALRFNARAYLHGHTVGGTNPSLVEALWAGNAVVAHGNGYNRWTAGEAGTYFADAQSCEEAITRILADDELVARCSMAARARARSAFSWGEVLFAYERECLSLLEGRSKVAEPALAVHSEAARWT